ncbi:MAG TPA: hypothetical protein VFN99_07575 [Gaiella sp.]|nr:hypothetical protein [Gaiella sp.]
MFRLVTLGAVTTVALALVGASLGSGRSAVARSEPFVTHGVVVGDVTNDSAVV